MWSFSTVGSGIRWSYFSVCSKTPRPLRKARRGEQTLRCQLSRNAGPKLLPTILLATRCGEGSRGKEAFHHVTSYIRLFKGTSEPRLIVGCDPLFEIFRNLSGKEPLYFMYETHERRFAAIYWFCNRCPTHAPALASIGNRAIKQTNS